MICVIVLLLECVSYNIFLFMTYRALEPVVIFIVLLFVIVSYSPHITAGVAGRIA